MRSSIASATLNWLTTTDGPPVVVSEGTGGYNKTQIPLNPEIGYGWVEYFQLALGMGIACGQMKFEKRAPSRLIPVTQHNGEVLEPTFFATVTQKGRILYKDCGVGSDFIVDSSCSLFQRVDAIDFQISADSAGNIDLRMLDIGESMLTMFLGSDIADQMLNKFNVSTVPSASIFKIPPHVNMHLFESMSEQLSGPIRKLQSQTKVLEYLTSLAHFVLNKKTFSDDGDIKSKIIQQLHDDLTNQMGKIPNMDELAPQYGLSARVLNEEFRKVYGKSIYSYMSDLRLNEAHEALIKSDAPMKSIAMNLGYSHVNHFICAFGKKFGYSPGNLRKSHIATSQ